jgi:hypothetical protein
MVEATREATMDITTTTIDIIREAEAGLVVWMVIATREGLGLVRVVAVFGLGELAKSRLDDIRTSWIGLVFRVWLAGL